MTYKLEGVYLHEEKDSTFIRIDFLDGLKLTGFDTRINKNDSLEDIAKSFDFFANEIRKLS